LLIVGSASARAEAAEHLAPLGLPETHRVWTSDVAADLGQRCAGVVLVGRPPTPKSSRDLRAAVAALATEAHYEARRVPVIVLAHEGMADACAWRLYEAGATAVIPLSHSLAAEDDLRDRLAALLEATLVAAATGTGRNSAAGQLEEHLGLRLRLFARRFETLALDVSGRAVRVRGCVETLDDRRRIRNVLAGAPGIDSVCTDGVRLVRTASPEALSRLVGARIEEHLGPHNTLHWHVADGRVVLAGALPRTDQLQRLLATLWTTPGVEAVDNDIVVSESMARDAVRTAQAIRRRWRTEGLGEGLRIGVIGPFVVVHGVPADPTRRRLALSAALEVPGVKSVIDADAGRLTH